MAMKKAECHIIPDNTAARQFPGKKNLYSPDFCLEILIGKNRLHVENNAHL
jgi:hypothetical protein